jgi:hypothetical protein
MADITARWAGAQDASSGSVYKIEYTLNNVDWVAITPNQAATAPYTPVIGELASSASYGDLLINLLDGSSFASSGYAYIGNALIKWSGKSTNQLTGVVWHSGAGAYQSGSRVIVAHESYTATDITIDLNVMLWRITHINSDGLISAPAYIWYFSPPVAPSNCCVVITRIQSDLGFVPRSGIGVQAYLEYDISFANLAGGHLDAQSSADKTQTTNAFGVTFHKCIKNSEREDVGSGDSPYIFILDSGSAQALKLRVNNIPNQNWVFLSQIATEVIYD